MILCVMRFPPAPNGHGGSQRAWFLLHALRQLAPVHFVLVGRKRDKDVATVSLKPVEPLVQSITTVDIPEWEPTARRRLGPLEAGWINLATMRSQDAPRISAAGLERVAAHLPTRAPDAVFAGRLPSAVIVQALLDRGLLTAGFRFVDFDDVMSKFRERQLRTEGPILGRQGRALLQLDIALIRRAERRIAASWDGASVCTDEDADALRATYPTARIVKIPNVVDREFLPPRPAGKGTRLLFVGNLGFLPNVQGLQAFARNAWPAIRAALPDSTLTVVGLHPEAAVHQLVRENGFTLHENVPEVLPFYQDADIVIVPILFGSGTRIKILEAMAHGRAVVTTAMGAEGLHLEHGRHAMIVRDMTGFAAAVIALAHDDMARQRMAEAARAFQQQEYSVPALSRAVAAAMTPTGRP